MTAQHTPGPWSVSIGDFADNGDARYILEGIKTIGLKDARLIAAAPDLLEALAKIVDWNTRPLDSGLDAGRGITEIQLHQARAAIAKATGATS